MIAYFPAQRRLEFGGYVDWDHRANNNVWHERLHDGPEGRDIPLTIAACLPMLCHHALSVDDKPHLAWRAPFHYVGRYEVRLLSFLSAFLSQYRRCFIARRADHEVHVPCQVFACVFRKRLGDRLIRHLDSVVYREDKPAPRSRRTQYWRSVKKVKDERLR